MADWVCPFGYWVGPEGQTEPVSGWQTHVDDAPVVAERHGLGPLGFFELHSRGWVPVTVNRYLVHPSFQLPGEMPRAQAAALLRVCAAHCREGQSVFIDDRDFDDPLVWGRYIRDNVFEGD